MTPKLIHPIQIALTQIDPQATGDKHPVFQEPMGRVMSKEPVTIPAQRKVGQEAKYRQRPGGDDPEYDGHFVVRASDLRRLEVTPRKGDRVTMLYVGTDDEQLANLHIEEVRPQGHYDGRPTLYFLFYRDKKTLAHVP